MHTRAMALAGSKLFVAGPPDVQDEEHSVASLLNPETQRRLAEQSAAFEGKRGALLAAVSRENARRPVIISYSTHPKEKMSLRASAGSPRTGPS